LVRRRATGEPLSRIKGWISFRGLRIQVRPEVFVPRDSTEWLVEEALRRLKGKRDPVVVDVGTGAGPVPLAIAHEMPRALVIGTDISAPSIALARANARRLKLPARFVVGDLLSTLPGKIVGRVHVITANVPFIGRLELPDVADEIVKFEPLISLTDNSPHGLALMERLAATAQEWLRPGGSLLIEVASDRSRKVAALLRHAGYAEVKSTRGPMPWNRVVSGQRPARG
jgi:release factor glutamine methyltransferase